MNTPDNAVKIKNGFTKEEIQAMREPQRDTLRFQIEGEDGKAKLNVYRIKPEAGVAYCNSFCNQYFESQQGILKLRVFSRVTNTAWKEIAFAERTKEIHLDQFLIEID